MQEAFGEEMDQLRLLAYFLSGQHIEYVVRNAIRTRNREWRLLAVFQVRDHEHDARDRQSQHQIHFEVPQ